MKQERENVVAMFKSKEGKELRKAIAKKSKFISENLPEQRKVSGMSLQH